MPTRAALPQGASPRRTASTAGSTAAVTRSTSPSVRATRSSRRCRWPRVVRRDRQRRHAVDSRRSPAPSSRPTARWSRSSAQGRRATLPASAATSRTCSGRSRGVADNGTGRRLFADFPVAGVAAQDRVRAGRTGKDDTSWFASFAPPNDPQYAVVMMISQGGTGAGTSRPRREEDLRGAVRRRRVRRSTPPSVAAPGRQAAHDAADDAARTASSPADAGPPGEPGQPSDACGYPPSTPGAGGRRGGRRDVRHRRRGSAAELASGGRASSTGCSMGSRCSRCCALGAVLIWSATRAAAARRRAGSRVRYLKQHMSQPAHRAGAGGADRRCWTTGCCAPTRRSIYVASVIGLLAVLSPLGSTINGAHSWIVLPAGFTIQPSEFAKVAIVVGVAMLLVGDAATARTRRAPSTSCSRSAFAAVPVALIMLQPDLGTTMVICFIVAGHARRRRDPAHVVRRAGRRRRCSGRVVAVQARRARRRTRSTGSRRSPTPSSSPRGVGYNTEQARIAIGSGGLTGSAGCSTAPRPTASSCPSSRPTSSSRWPARSSGLLGAGGDHRAAGRRAVADHADRPAGRGPVRPPGGRGDRAAGSRSRRSRTSG